MRISTFSASVKQLSVILLAAVFMSLNMYASTLSRVETFNPAELNSDEYRPMLEMGKTWEYRVVDLTWAGIAHRDVWRTLKIDGTKEIDGKEYYVMHCYLDGSSEPYCDTPVGYFREDLNAHKVFFII